MKKTVWTMILVAAVVSTGCAKRIKAGGEPLDPTGEGELAKEADALPKLLEGTVLHYGFDDATLTASDQKKLQKLAEALRVRPWAAIRIAGHCDERGTEEYNLALGQRRADTAREYLLALGVTEDSVDTVTFGEEVPVDNEISESGWAANRRAEFGAMPLEMFGYLDTGAQQ